MEKDDVRGIMLELVKDYVANFNSRLPASRCKLWEYIMQAVNKDIIDYADLVDLDIEKPFISTDFWRPQTLEPDEKMKKLAEAIARKKVANNRV